MDSSEISKLILDEVRNSSPADLDELVKRISLKYDLPRNEILPVITRLIDDKEIDLNLPIRGPTKLSRYIYTIDATWFWLEIVFCFISMASILLINDSSSPLIYIRNIMGFIFSLFLPGYAFIKAILPYREFSLLERIMFSIGCSIALVPFIGLFLNYLNNLTATPILLSISTLTIILSLIGIGREFNLKRNK